MGFESEKKKLCCSSKINKNESFSDYLLEEERGEEKTLVVMRLDGGDYDGCLKFGSSDSLFPGLYDDVTLNCLALVCRSDYPSLSCLNKRFNLLMKSGHLYELRKKLEIVENWVYMVCDPRGWEAFDPIKNKCMKLPKIPCDECFNHADKESLTVGSELLVFGRELFEFAIWKYSLIHHTWLKCEEMNCPRCLFGSSSLGSIAIVAGGSDKSGNVLKSAELYDSSTGRWEILPTMHSPRRLCSGFFMDEKFYVIGGMTSPTDSLTCGEELDLKTRKWRRIDNQLYAVEHLTNMVKKYDKVKKLWDVLGRLPVRADSSNGWGLALKACGEQLLVVGGQRSQEDEAIVLNSWCPKSGVKNGTFFLLLTLLLLFIFIFYLNDNIYPTFYILEKTDKHTNRFHDSK